MHVCVCPHFFGRQRAVPWHVEPLAMYMSAHGNSMVKRCHGSHMEVMATVCCWYSMIRVTHGKSLDGKGSLHDKGHTMAVVRCMVKDRGGVVNVMEKRERGGGGGGMLTSQVHPDCPGNCQGGERDRRIAGTAQDGVRIEQVSAQRKKGNIPRDTTEPHPLIISLDACLHNSHKDRQEVVIFDQNVLHTSPVVLLFLGLVQQLHNIQQATQ